MRRYQHNNIRSMSKIIKTALAIILIVGIAFSSKDPKAPKHLITKDITLQISSK